MMDDTELRCANPECRVSQDGKCVEGLAFDKCQFYGRALEEIEKYSRADKQRSGEPFHYKGSAFRL